jgi:hypothetical protein
MGCTGAQLHRAVRLDTEEAHALAWARASDPELAAALAAARASRIASHGRQLEAEDLLDRIGDATALAPRTRAMIEIAAGLVGLGRGDLAAPAATGRRALAALAAAPDAEMAAYAQMTVAFGAVYSGEAGWRGEDARARSLGMQASDVMRATTLLFSAQFHTYAGELEIARERLQAGQALAEACDARAGWNLPSLLADLALGAGDGEEAARHYLCSIEEAAARREPVQVSSDLHGMAVAFALAGDDATALETLGMALGLSVELGLGEQWLSWGFPGADALGAARDRLGPDAEAALARGRAVPAGRRIDRARRLVGTTAQPPTRLA